MIGWRGADKFDPEYRPSSKSQDMLHYVYSSDAHTEPHAVAGIGSFVSIGSETIAMPLCLSVVGKPRLMC